MKNKELIEILKEMPKNMEVVVFCDGKVWNIYKAKVFNKKEIEIICDERPILFL